MFPCGSQELADKIDLENYAEMLDFDFSSFSLTQLKLKGNVFIRSRSPYQTQFKIVVVQICSCFWTRAFQHTSSFLAAHIPVTYIGEYPLPAHSLILNWSESKLVTNTTYKSTKSPALKTFVSIFKNCKIYICLLYNNFSCC